MIQEYEENLLKFLVQDRTAKKYIGQIEASVFGTADYQLVYELLETYLSEFKAQPEKANLLQFFQEASDNQNLNQEVAKHLERVIRQVYEPLEAETTQIRKTLVEFCQRKMAKDLIKDFAPKIKNANTGDFSNFLTQVGKIHRLKENLDENSSNRGEFLLLDHRVGLSEVVEATPTYLKGLNRMTAAGGFYSPQLVVLMAAPKAFKTGTAVNIAVNLVRDGVKVYYADCENGEGKIRDRAKQCMLGATYEELKSGKMDEVLTEIVRRFKARGGDMKIDFYPPKSKTMLDVEAELEYLRDEYGWKPDVIFYDGLDLFKPVNSKVVEKRLAIQEVYFDAIRLNKKWGTWCLTPSHVNRNAVNKKVLNMGDFSEDFGKAANAHAAFAICQDEDEAKQNIARIVPVMQREGVQQIHARPCYVYQDREKMLVEELNPDDFIEEVKETKKNLVKTKKKLKDE